MGEFILVPAAQVVPDKELLNGVCVCVCGLRAVYGTRDSGSIPVRSLNGTTLITDRAGILNRWAEHFQRVLNQESKFDQSVLDEIP